LPDKAEASGFKFRHETLPSALSAIFGGKTGRERASDLGGGLVGAEIQTMENGRRRTDVRLSA
jgi:hypothetical protein